MLRTTVQTKPGCTADYLHLSFLPPSLRDTPRHSPTPATQPATVELWCWAVYSALPARNGTSLHPTTLRTLWRCEAADITNTAWATCLRSSPSTAAPSPGAPLIMSSSQISLVALWWVCLKGMDVTLMDLQTQYEHRGYRQRAYRVHTVLFLPPGGSQSKQSKSQ